MDPKTIVFYLCMKGMGLDAIHEDLVHTLGKSAVAYSAVGKCIPNARFSPKTEAVPPEPTEGEHNPVDEAILAALGEYPVSSGRELSRATCLPRPTVHSHLMQLLHFTLHHLWWTVLSDR
jgi:hypothetical protein